MKIRGRVVVKVGLLLSAVLTIGAIVSLAGPFGTFFTLEGNLTSPFDFGTDSVTQTYIGPKPTTVLIQEFVLQPGVATGWHYHRGLSYVILLKGTIQQQEAAGCGVTTDHAGSGFIEQPGEVHQVINKGPEAAIMAWATIFPSSDFPAGDNFAGSYAYPYGTPCQ